MELELKLTKKDRAIVRKIAKRAAKLLGMEEINVQMDLEYMKQDLDLQRLLDADDFNFSHDILGINKCLDHDTGKLKNCFLPRFAKV